MYLILRQVENGHFLERVPKVGKYVNVEIQVHLENLDRWVVPDADDDDDDIEHRQDHQ